MAAITLANLRSRILERVNMENSSFVSTTELNALINIEAAELHDLVVSSHEDNFTASTTFTISTGNTYELASITNPSFYKLRGLDKDSGNGVYEEVKKFSFNNRNRKASNAFQINTTDVRFRIIGSKLYLTPDDGATGNYRLWYIPAFTDLSADGDTLSYAENWYEYVIAGVGAKLLAKEESDISAPLRDKEAIKVRIKQQASQDASGPDKMIRVRAGGDEWYL